MVVGFYLLFLTALEKSNSFSRKSSLSSTFFIVVINALCFIERLALFNTIFKKIFKTDMYYLAGGKINIIITDNDFLIFDAKAFKSGKLPVICFVLS